jgi:uncharacterized protein
MFSSTISNDYLTTILLFGTLGLFTLLISKSRGFFQTPSYQNVPLPLSQLLAVFTAYLSMTLLGLPIAIICFKFIYSRIYPENSLPIFMLSWLQLLVIAITFLIIRFLLCNQHKNLWKQIWRKNSSKQTIMQDIRVGILAWVISFPLVVTASQLCDFLLYLFFHLESYEQVAVRYLKQSIYSPYQLIPALLMIICAAPIIEELLFRGCLQSYLRRYMKKASSIVLSSICFSAFHFSLSQGIGNISLLLSLFIFAIFLGFIYERQGSLLASISLHMTLNIVSVVRILLAPQE